MEALFLKLFNMSITASWLVLAVVVLRLLMKKVPKSMICFLWLLVAVRLIFSISIESVLSLVPSTETISEESLYSDTPVIDSGISAINDRINPVISESLAPEVGTSVNPMQVVTYVASIVWMAGMGCMLIYALISYFRLRFKVREGVEDENHIWLCDRISTPFILGVIRPRIFIPTSVEKDDKEYVIAHERAHLKRKDHWWKPLGFLLLTVYWFNPVMWLAYVLLCKDIEYACDEKVLDELGVDCRKAYSNALVNCSVSRKSVAVCPLAFGEVGVKNRIKSVLSYKKPAFWVITVALVACIVVVLAFLTNPITIKHYGRDITEEEFYENYEDCLKKLSVNEVPRFNFMTILEGEEIRKLNLSREAVNPVKSDYLKTLNNIITAAVMAFGATQYEEFTSDLSAKNIRNHVLDGAIDYAFENGVFETYYEQIYICIMIDSTGYKKNGSGFLKAVAGEKQYISWTLYMERRDTYFGNYYYNKFYSDTNTKTYRDVTPTLSIRLNRNCTFKMNRGTGMEGDIRGTYRLERDRLILENIEAEEVYVFALIDSYAIKYLAEESDPIRVYTGIGVEELENEIFEFEGEYNNSEMEISNIKLFYGQDVNGNTPFSIVVNYYKSLNEEHAEIREKWFTDEYIIKNKNVKNQNMQLVEIKGNGVEESDIRESDRAWIDEIKGKYSCYCFIQTKAELLCKEDGPSGNKGETIEQQYYFALVLDPEDGRWKIDDFGYPGFDIPESEEKDTTSYKVEKEEYELAYIIGINEHEVLDEIEISVDYVDWISDNTQPNGFRIDNPVEDTNIYLVDEDAEYQINHYFSNIYEGTLDESTNKFKVSEETFIEYQKEIGFGLFWIKVEDGKVLDLVEQYVP